MPCENVRETIADASREALLSEPSASIAAHLETCPDCEALYAAARDLAGEASSWREEGVPPWPRPVMGRGSNLVGWLALAACLVLTILVAFRVEVRHSEHGWLIAFGGDRDAPTITVDQLEVALEAQRLQTAEQVTRLLVLQGDVLHDELRGLLAESARRNAETRSRELDLLQARLETDRLEDWDLFQTQILRLLERQNRQNRNLEQLAVYVRATGSD